MAWPCDFNVELFALKHGLEIKPESLCMRKDLVTFDAAYVPEAPSKKPLDTEQTLCCATCKTVLCEGLKVVETPIDNWRELLDCWACHKETFAITTGSSSLQPKDGVAFMTCGSLIVNANTLCSKPCCPSCAEPLGFEDEAGYIHLFRSKVSLNGASVSSEQVLTSQLEALKDTQSLHSFRICNQKDEGFGLRVVSWDAVAFLPEPKRVIVGCVQPDLKEGEVLPLYDHDFDNVLQCLKMETPLGCLFEKCN